MRKLHFLLLSSLLLLIPTKSFAQVTIVPSRSIATGGGGGGSVNGPASAIDNDLTCWDGTSGTLIKDCGKTLTDFLSSSASSVQDGFFGNVSLRDDTNPSHYLTLTDAEDLSAGRTLSIITGNASRSLTFTANATIGGTNSGDITLSGTPTFLSLAGQVVTMNTIVNADVNASAAIALSKLATQANNTIVSNVSGGVAVPSANTLTAVLDATACGTQGSIFTRQAAAWVCLTPGTSGNFLQTQGAGANAQWAAGASGVARSGSTTDGHLAIWNGNNADSIKDGGVVASFTPSGGDDILYYQGTGDNLVHPVTVGTGLSFSSGTLSASLTSSSSTTFTNKTYDAEGTGNTLTIPIINLMLGGNCQDTTGSTPFSTKAGGATGICITGSNENLGAAKFTATGQEIQGFVMLPYDLSSTVVDVYGMYKSATDNNTGHNAVFKLSTSCTGDGAAGDPSWTASATITDAIKGTANQYNLFSSTGITMQSSPACSTNNILRYKLVYDATSTSTGDQHLIALYLVLRRGM